MKKTILLSGAIFFILLAVSAVYLTFAYFTNLRMEQEIANNPLNDYMPAIMSNAKAMEDENLEVFMNAIHPDSPAYDNTEIFMTGSFNQFDFDVDITDAQVISESQDNAVVQVVQTTRETSNSPDFQDNRVVVQHVMRPHDGVWKVYLSNIQDVEYLE